MDTAAVDRDGVVLLLAAILDGIPRLPGANCAGHHPHGRPGSGPGPPAPRPGTGTPHAGRHVLRRVSRPGAVPHGCYQSGYHPRAVSVRWLLHGPV
ncbi:MAG: hypothetical protein ACRDRU_09435 [Pseudonocardiaceae bacterium]